MAGLHGLTHGTVPRRMLQRFQRRMIGFRHLQSDLFLNTALCTARFFRLTRTGAGRCNNVKRRATAQTAKGKALIKRRTLNSILFLLVVVFTQPTFLGSSSSSSYRACTGTLLVPSQINVWCFYRPKIAAQIRWSRGGVWRRRSR